MLKLVILGIAIALLLWLVFGRIGGRATKGTPSARGRRGDRGAESMVSCAYCGVHLPRSEAVGARGLHYCSAAHRDVLEGDGPQPPER